MNRGDIFYIRHAHTVGSEIETKNARPAIVVSNNSLNHHSGVVEVVFLTTAPKKDMPTHVEINATGVKSTALCEQVNSVAVERIGDFCGECTEEEMAGIDKALLTSLGIVAAEDNHVHPTADISKEEEWLMLRLAEVTEERDRYVKMLDIMLGAHS